MTADTGPVTAQARLNALMTEHETCTWEQVGLCVYCTTHHVRLYQGELPEQRRTVPKCEPNMHDWDPERGEGFYLLCRRCDHQEWSD